MNRNLEKFLFFSWIIVTVILAAGFISASIRINAFLEPQLKETCSYFYKQPSVSKCLQEKVSQGKILNQKNTSSCLPVKNLVCSFSE